MDTVAVSKNLTYSGPGQKIFFGGFGLQGGLQDVYLMHCDGLWVALHAHDVRGSLCGPSGTPRRVAWLRSKWHFNQITRGVAESGNSTICENPKMENLQNFEIFKNRKLKNL